MSDLPIYYAFKLKDLPRWSNNAKLLGYYFVFKRRISEREHEMRKEILVVPVLAQGERGTYADEKRGRPLKEIAKVFEKRAPRNPGRPVKDPNRDYLYERLEGFEHDRDIDGRTGFVLVTAGDLRFFGRYNDTLYLSGCVVDTHMFMDADNPEIDDEASAAGQGAGGRQKSFFSLKVEGDNQKLIPSVRTPYLIGQACRKEWYDTDPPDEI